MIALDDSDRDMKWELIVMLIVTVVAIVGCVLMIIPCSHPLFRIIYLFCTAAHFVATWITQLTSVCDEEFAFARTQTNFIAAYRVTLFFFNILTTMFCVLLNFNLNISL